jgi:DNA-binding MarR family transcriptional regulator
MRKTAKIPDNAGIADPFEELIGYHVRRLSVKVMTDFANELKPLDLNPADASILFVIGSNPGVTQSLVGKILGILRPNMAPLVGSLVRRGYVRRESINGRSQALLLTAEGLAACRQATAAAKAHERQIFGSLSPPARQKLITQLRALWQRERE